MGGVSSLGNYLALVMRQRARLGAEEATDFLVFLFRKSIEYRSHFFPPMFDELAGPRPTVARTAVFNLAFNSGDSTSQNAPGGLVSGSAAMRACPEEWCQGQFERRGSRSKIVPDTFS